MRKSHFRQSVALVLVFALCPTFLPSQEEDDTQAQIAAAIERYGGSTLRKAWRGARVLESFGDDAVPSCRRLLLHGTGIKRLMARPVAEFCITCKDERELLERRQDG